MFWQKRMSTTIRPLFAIPPEPVEAPFSEWANEYVGAGDGLRMMAAQAANEALRHCRIGLVRRKNATLDDRRKIRP